MKCTKSDLLLYAVTDRYWLNGATLYEQVEQTLKGGSTFIQLREKQLEDEKFLTEAINLKRLCKKYEVPFVINDNVDIAIKMDADGVHVGQSDMQASDVRAKIGPNKILGVSAQTVEQAIFAEQAGADYLGVGAVFQTGSKDDADAVSQEMLVNICQAVNIPVIAIGGISFENMAELKGTGICGVAVISAIFAQKDIIKATAKLKGVAKEMFAEGKQMKTALTIAGSDSCGGAGIQADIKTMSANGIYAMSVITALTAQNTMGVSGILSVPTDFLGAQLDAIFTDIFPDAIKIGMVSGAELIEVIAKKLEEYQARHIVVDPVMVATSGAKLLQDEAIEGLRTRLFPLAEIVTPNIPEAELLAEMKIANARDMEVAAQTIGEKYGCAVLCKGGHNINDANDFLWQPEGVTRWFEGERIDNPNTHGTGCTLSSAIASGLAKGMLIEDAVNEAKKYLSGALAAMLDLGKGSGPMNHVFNLGGDRQ